jgi:hypothetical protein
MSLAEIEKAVDALSPEELAKLAAYIARHDKLVWDEEIQRDFALGGKHADVLAKLDAQIDGGESTPLP